MTTDGGGWTLAAWSKGDATAHMPADFFVRQVNAYAVHLKDTRNFASSLGVESLSKGLNTRDAMLKANAYSAAPIIHNGRGVWQYDTPACDGPLGHTARTAGCANHGGNDNYGPGGADQYNIAIYSTPIAAEAIVPGWLNYTPRYELCYSGRGWCDFEFYLR